MRLLKFIQIPLLFRGLPRKPTPRVRKQTATQRRSRPKSSAPELVLIWSELLSTYFPEREDLKSYTIHWSSRSQKRVLGSCCVARRKVIVARELNYPEFKEVLSPLLYHELCHAVLGDKVGFRGTKRAWHGPQFKALEQQHPGISELNSWIKSGGWRKAVRSDRAKRARAHILSKK